MKASEGSSEDQSDCTLSEGLETADTENAEINVPNGNARRNAAIIGELKRRDNC